PAPYGPSTRPYTTLFRSGCGRTPRHRDGAGREPHERDEHREHDEGHHDANEARHRQHVEDAAPVDDGDAEGRAAVELRRGAAVRSEEHTSELQSRENLVC